MAETPIVSAIRSVAKAFALDCSIYSYHDAFAELWSTLDRNHGKDVIIVWDETPVDRRYYPIPTHEYLSPLEWALCAHDRGLKNSTITIFDANPAKNRNARSCGFFRFLDKSVLQWLRFYPIHSSFPVIKEWVTGRQDPPASQSPANMDFYVKKLVQLLLTEPGDESNRHALSNIVGPMLLLNAEDTEDNPDPTELHHGLALRTLLRHVDLLRVPGELSDSDIEKAEGHLAECIGRAIPFQLILVDDQAHHGWKAWLEYSLGPGIPVEDAWTDGKGGNPGEDFLNRVLKALEALSQDTRDSRFQLSLSHAGSPPITDKTSEILFLDLRLFANTDVTKEAAFYAKLLPAAEHFKESSGPYAWPGFKDAELSIMRTWCESNASGPAAEPTFRRESDAHHLVLTLLPRLLALLDMSYPIILFSSTGQRSIIDKLSPYGNIIMECEKPRFWGGNPVSSRANATNKLRLAIAQGLRFLRIRNVCAAVQSHARQASQKFSVRSLVPNNVAFNELNMAVFLDESGSVHPDRASHDTAWTIEPKEQISVTGLVLFLPNVEALENIDDALAARLPDIRLDKDYARQNVPMIMNELEVLCAQYDTKAVTVTVSGCPADEAHFNAQGDDSFRDFRVGDNLHRKLFRSVVEIAVYGLGRQVASSLGLSTLKVSIFGPTRELPLPLALSLPNRDELKASFFDHWGLETVSAGEYALLYRLIDAANDFRRSRSASSPQAAIFNSDAVNIQNKVSNSGVPPREEALRTIQYDTPRSLVEPLLEQYSTSRFSPTLERCRAYSLNAYYRWNKETRTLHFLTDALASKLRGIHSRNVPLMPFPQSFGLRLSRTAASLFKINYALASEQLPIALTEAVTIVDDNLQELPFLVKELADDVREMPGKSLLALDHIQELSSSSMPGSIGLSTYGQISQIQGSTATIQGQDGKAYTWVQESHPTFLLRVGIRVQFDGHPAAYPNKYIADSMTPCSARGMVETCERSKVRTGDVLAGFTNVNVRLEDGRVYAIVNKSIVWRDQRGTVVGYFAPEIGQPVDIVLFPEGADMRGALVTTYPWYLVRAGSEVEATVLSVARDRETHYVRSASASFCWQDGPNNFCLLGQINDAVSGKEALENLTVGTAYRVRVRYVDSARHIVGLRLVG